MQTSEDLDEAYENKPHFENKAAMSYKRFDSYNREVYDRALRNVTAGQTAMSSMPSDATYHLQRAFIAYSHMMVIHL